MISLKDKRLDKQYEENSKTFYYPPSVSCSFFKKMPLCISLAASLTKLTMHFETLTSLIKQHEAFLIRMRFMCVTIKRRDVTGYQDIQTVSKENK